MPRTGSSSARDSQDQQQQQQLVVQRDVVEPSSSARPRRKRGLQEHLVGQQSSNEGSTYKKLRPVLAPLVNGVAGKKRGRGGGALSTAGNRVSTRRSSLQNQQECAAVVIQQAFRARRRGGGHLKLPTTWVELEPWEEVQQAENCLVPDPELVNLLATAKVGSNSTPLAEILLLSDIWACQNSRAVCKAWNLTVDSLTDGQFLPLQRIFVNPSYPYMGRVVRCMRTSEADFMVKPEDQCVDIGQMNRELFVNFLVDIQEKLLLSVQTLSLAMNYIDRFISTTCVSTNRLLLLGVTSLFIASKFEEVDRIPMMHFLEVTDHTCTVQEVQEMELDILRNLDFRLSPPTPISFLQFLSCLPIDDVVVKHFAQYLAELSYQHRSFLAYKPSQVAEAALFVSLEFLNPPLLATICKCRHLISDILQYTPRDVKACMADLQQLLLKVDSSHCPAIKRKYSKEDFSFVGTLFDMNSHPLKAAGRAA